MKLVRLCLCRIEYKQLTRLEQGVVEVTSNATTSSEWMQPDLPLLAAAAILIRKVGQLS